MKPFARWFDNVTVTKTCEGQRPTEYRVESGSTSLDDVCALEGFEDWYKKAGGYIKDVFVRKEGVRYIITQWRGSFLPKDAKTS